MAYRWIFIPWWLLVFPIREFKKCQGMRGWKPSWTGWFRVIESIGQKRFYSFLWPVILWSLNLHLWHFDKWSSDAIGISWPLFGQSWLKIWLKFIFLKSLLELQVHHYRDSEQLNFWPPSLFFWFGFPWCFSYMNNFFSSSVSEAFELRGRYRKWYLHDILGWTWSELRMSVWRLMKNSLYFLFSSI